PKPTSYPSRPVFNFLFFQVKELPCAATRKRAPRCSYHCFDHANGDDGRRELRQTGLFSAHYLSGWNWIIHAFGVEAGALASKIAHIPSAAGCGGRAQTAWGQRSLRSAGNWGADPRLAAGLTDPIATVRQSTGRRRASSRREVVHAAIPGARGKLGGPEPAVLAFAWVGRVGSSRHRLCRTELA